MTQPVEAPPLATLTRQQVTFGHYHALLNEIQALGIERFAAMIDTSTEEELTELLTAANVVRLRIRAFQAKVTP